MPLAAAAILALALRCAPSVHPATLIPLITVESGGDPLAIGVNGATPYSLHPKSSDQAIAIASRLLQNGADLDLGLAQINGRTLRRLGLSVRDAFDPCANLSAAGHVLVDAYRLSASRQKGTQAALHSALSRYNTGSQTKGLANGYVARVLKAAGQSPGPTPEPRKTAVHLAWDAFSEFASAEPATLSINAEGVLK